MALNIGSLKSKELLARTLFKCKHRHNGIEHPECFNTEHGITERIGFFDIECSNLKANFGIVLSYCIKPLNGEVIKRVIKAQELKDGSFDKRLMEQFCKDARKFDRLIGFYSARFDMPFLRTRSEFWKLDFPIFREVCHTDIYDIIKHKFNFHSRRLEVVCSFFGIAAKHHPLTPDVWIKCLSGNKAALNYVLVHNEEDVNSTEGLWLRVQKYARKTESSI